jgi:glycosyltransferase involved in cell wall biosynthesis
MIKILFLTKGIHSSSARYRALFYQDFFIKDKYLTAHYGLSKKITNYLLALINVARFDIVFLQRKLVPIPYFFILRFLSKKIIYDFDDAIFLNSNGDLSKKRYKRFKYICEKSDLIFSGNQYLQSFAKKINSQTFILPTCINTKVYQVKANKSKEFIDLVWVGHESTVKYLLAVIPNLEKANEKIKKLRIVNISNVTLSSKKIKIKNVSWNERSQYHYIKSAWLGLAPLDESNWSKGKCAFKVLQYAAAGIPILSSNVGVNSELISHYQNGYLIKEDSDWEKYILKLMVNKNLYKNMIRNSEILAEDYDYKKNYKRLLLIIRKKFLS